MRGQSFWVSATDIKPDQAHSGSDFADQNEALFAQGCVSLTLGLHGSQLQWDVHSPCLAALTTVSAYLRAGQAPFVLKFFALGWFEEIYTDVESACGRVEDIIARGDRYLPSRIFFHQQEPCSSRLPQAVAHVMDHGSVLPEYSVECFYEPASGRFAVHRVGPKSAIAQLWGTATTSLPCKPAGDFGDAVSQAYLHALSSGQVQYDQVIALFRLPSGERKWVPYHRAVVPLKHPAGLPMVAVVAEIARVDFRVI